MTITLKILFFFWGLVGMLFHAFLKADQPTIPAVFDYYRKDIRPFVVSLMSYILLYGVWAGMSRWAPALHWDWLVKYSDPWIGTLAVAIGYVGDSLWPKLISLAQKKAGVD